jgi:hypothetical protein
MILWRVYQMVPFNRTLIINKLQNNDNHPHLVKLKLAVRKRINKNKDYFNLFIFCIY